MAARSARRPAMLGWVMLPLRLQAVLPHYRYRALLAAMASSSLVGAAPDAQEVVLPADGKITIEIDFEPVRAQVVTGLPNRLLLSPQGLSRLRWRNEGEDGVSLSVFRRHALRGQVRDVRLLIEQRQLLAEAFWFRQPVLGNTEATLGPLLFVQPRVTFPLGAPVAGPKARYRFAMVGSADTLVGTRLRDRHQPFFTVFDLEHARDYPIASAALGAHLARIYRGTLSGPGWRAEIGFGIKRRLRWLTLERPVRFGPFSLTRLAVRVRDRADGSGTAATAIAEAGDLIDPDDIVVEGRQRGPKPVYALTLPRALLAPCERLTFDRAARQIELICPATPAAKS